MGLRRLIRFLRGTKTPAATGFVDFYEELSAQRIRGRVVAPAGLHLIVAATIDGVPVNRIVRVAQAREAAEFWREWRAVGGGPLYDEDGAEWDPEISAG